MTDLRHRLDSILGNAPAPPDDLDHIVAAGRRAVRRRTALTGAAGTAGVAALTAAVVVPIVAVSRHNSPTGIPAGGQPTAKTSPPSQHCKIVLVRRSGKGGPLTDPRQLKLKLAKLQEEGRLKSIKLANGKVVAVRTCSVSTLGPHDATPTPTPTGSPTPIAPPAPRYHYTDSPTKISQGFADELNSQLDNWGLTVVYQRPFAQETSKLESGHPRYFDGNDDVRVSGKLADVGVQVTHAVTEQVPFDAPCTAPRCVQTTLPDGSGEQVSRIHAGTGGGTVIVVEVHRPNGLVVEAQQSNYGFGPDATRARGTQPLTMEQLTSLAEDPAFTF
jgi:hypothetical protein